MNSEDALNWCEDFRDNIIKTGVKKEKYTLALKAMREAIIALLKQIPKKPNNMACPNCGRIFLRLFGQTKGPKYCDNCGQAIDWGI